MESTRVQIEGETFQLRPWSADDGNRWWLVLGTTLLDVAPTIAGGSATEMQSMAALVRLMDVEQLLSFGKKCVEYTDVVGRDAQDSETVRPLGEMPMHLRGKQDVWTWLMVEHAKAQFAGPFSRLMRRLAAEAADRAAKEKSK